MRRLGLAVTLSKEDFARYEAERKAAERRAARPRRLNLPLLDQLKNPFRIRRHYVPARAAARILGSRLQRAASAASTAIARRSDQRGEADLAADALGRALDDLPGHARRFARWKARNDAARARVKEGSEPWRSRRASPLRMGPPPGGRLWRYDPDAPRRKNIREIDEILAHAHALAVYALNPRRPDTS